MDDARWKIDELAQRAGVTVDTIRYYGREGLLEPPERSGRHKLYGNQHVERLERIRGLQEQRFSLAAIRAIVNVDRPGLEGLFATEGRTYSLDDLVERAGVDAELVAGLREVGLLADPTELGRDAYDESDLGMLTAARATLDAAILRTPSAAALCFQREMLGLLDHTWVERVYPPPPAR